VKYNTLAVAADFDHTAAAVERLGAPSRVVRDGARCRRGGTEPVVLRVGGNFGDVVLDDSPVPQHDT